MISSLFGVKAASPLPSLGVLGVLAVQCLLSGCARPPGPLQQGPFLELTIPAALNEAGTAGQRVRWGGRVVTVTPRVHDTCFEIVRHALNAEARPTKPDASDGRFIACAPGFFDPAVYEAGREVTVTGVLDGSTTGKIGEIDYRYPQLRADVVYLWPKETAERVYVYSPWYDPWYPYGWWRPYRGRHR